MLINTSTKTDFLSHFLKAKVRRFLQRGLANLAKKMAFSDILQFLLILAKSSTEHPMSPCSASNSSDRCLIFELFEAVTPPVTGSKNYSFLNK